MLSLTMAVLVAGSCSKSSNNDNGGGGASACSLSVSFSTNIKRILDASCAPCHGPSSGNSSALARWTYDGTFSSAQSRAGSIASLVASGSMPKGSPLPQAVRDSISCWNGKGAPN